MEKISKRNNKGQVMVLSVVMLGGILLSASAVAGLLTIYQIRGSNDIVNSTKAFFAADAGIEDITWCEFKGGTLCNAEEPLHIDFEDNSVYFDAALTFENNEINVLTRGYAAGGRVIRILETIFSQ